MHPAQLLEWYIEAGVDEATGETPVNRLLPSLTPPQEPAIIPIMTEQVPAPISPAAVMNTIILPAEANTEARRLANNASTLTELEAAVRAFEGCTLKKTAMKTVFADGNPQAQVMVIGEAPGAQEDIQGIPFCGPSGQLLDKIFASINLRRTGQTPSDSFYITNTIFWRPPGNRTPSPAEMAICEPFVEKHIALIQPRLLVLMGGVALKAILKNDLALGRQRGKFYQYTNTYLQKPISVAVTFHPSYLLRSPSQKRLAWADMLLIRDWLDK